MKITCEWYPGARPQFNVSLSSAEGKQPFVTIKGCRLVTGSSGQFVSWPAQKNESTGKWWNHVYASEAFGLAVLEEAQKSMPKEDTRTQSERRPKPPVVDDSVPF